MSEQPGSLWSGSYLNAATSRMIEGQIPFPHPLFPLSVRINLQDNKRDSPLCRFYLFYVSSTVSHHLPPTLLPRKRMQSGPLYPSLEKWTRVKGGTLFSHSASRDSFLPQPSHPSLPLPLSCNPKSTLLLLHLAAFHPSFLYVLLSFILLTLITAAFALFMCLAQVKSIYPT